MTVCLKLSKTAFPHKQMCLVVFTPKEVFVLRSQVMLIGVSFFTKLDPSTPYLIVTYRSGVGRYSMPEERMDIIHRTYYERITGSDFDSATGDIYFSNSRDDSLFKMDINGSSAEPVRPNFAEFFQWSNLVSALQSA